ncbi:thiol-activated cytolysin family protein [Chryseobacterium potabilaquae]|uniref:Streptolysin O n=1 Tax=Chryseobacterium potabilaquae TaxID=2675057 RepID=A0A6N4X453_9FLAO|nr:thiol-activated cytolysin family protein [Chryseobacterium potabilaquae]CAA7194246.1 Streptolysin O [Chryseobacterium potabilaquae]
MKLKLLTPILLTALLYSCNDETMLEKNNYEQITLQQSSIYDGPATQLIKTKISNHHSGTLHKDYPNCEEITEKQEKTFDSFTRLGTGAELMWPGNIIQGQTIKTGQMATIPIGDEGRNPIEVKVDAFSSNSTVPSSKMIESPTPGKVQIALSEIINGYYDSGTYFPANYSIDIQRTFSSKQLQMALNIGYTGMIGLDGGFTFGINFNKNKSYYAVTLKQKFFQVSVNSKTGLKGNDGWIKSSYPQEQLDPYITPDNPPVYISTVTYGRLYTLVYESDESEAKIEQALNFAYKNPAASITTAQKLEYAATLQNARVYVKQLGGSATAGLEASISTLAGSFDAVRNFVTTGAEASKINPGYPIEYTAVNIKSNLPATVKVEDIISYKNCPKNEYKLVLKNIDYTTLPILIDTVGNTNNSVYYLSSGESIEFPFSTNFMEFTYKGSPLTKIDLNNGKISDHIKFKNTASSAKITYRRHFMGMNGVLTLFENYKNMATATAYTIFDEDGINGGVSAQLEGSKDLPHNTLKIEIKKKNINFKP